MDLEKTIQQLRNQLSDSGRVAAEKDSLNKTIGSLREWCIATSLALHSHLHPLDHKISHLEPTVQQLHTQNAHLVQLLHMHEQKYQCEVLYADGRIVDAAVSLLEMTNATSEQVRTNKLIMDWLASTFGITNRDKVLNWYNQSLQTNAYRHWK